MKNNIADPAHLQPSSPWRRMPATSGISFAPELAARAKGNGWLTDCILLPDCEYCEA